MLELAVGVVGIVVTIISIVVTIISIIQSSIKKTDERNQKSNRPR